MLDHSNDGITWRPVARVDKYDRRQVDKVKTLTGLRAPEGAALSYHCTPRETVEIASRNVTTVGFSKLSTVLLGGPTGILDADRIRLGVASQVGKVNDPTEICFKSMDTTYPDQNNGVSIFKVTFGENDANFNWDYWSLDILTPNQMMDDAILYSSSAKLGVKNGGTWVLTVSFSWVLEPAPVGASRF